MHDKRVSLGAWTAIGAGIGAALGAAINNIGVGLPIGIAIGLAIGVAQTRRADDGTEAEALESEE